MRALRTIAAAAAVVLLAGCAADPERMPTLRSVRVADMEFARGGASPDTTGAADTTGDGIPSRIELAVEVDNPSRGIKIRRARLRISYRGQRVAMLTLGKAVKIPRRSRSQVRVPLRVNVARNSATLPMRAAVRRRDASAITVEWDAAVRAGVLRGAAAGEAVPLSRVVPEQMLDEVWRALDRFVGEDDNE